MSYGSVFFSSKIGSVVESVPFDEEYKELWNTFSLDDGKYRILWLPGISPTKYDLATFSGYDSAALHVGKPAIYSGRFTQEKLPIYIMRSLYEKEIYFSISQVLSYLNVKYIVFDRNKQSIHFDDSKHRNLSRHVEMDSNLVMIKDSGSISIYENKLYSSRVQRVSNPILTSGSVKTITDLSSVGINLNRYPIIFLSNIQKDKRAALLSLDTSIIAIHNDTIGFLLHLDPNVIEVGISKHMTSQDPNTGWSVLSDSKQNPSRIHAVGPVLHTLSKERLTVPIISNKIGKNSIYLYLYKGPNEKLLNVSIENNGKLRTRSIHLLDSYEHYEWIELGEFNFETKNSEIVFKTDSQAAIGKIIITQNSQTELLEMATNLLKDKDIFYAFNENNILSEADQAQNSCLNSKNSIKLRNFPILTSGSHSIFIDGQFDNSNLASIFVNNERAILEKIGDSFYYVAEYKQASNNNIAITSDSKKDFCIKNIIFANTNKIFQVLEENDNLDLKVDYINDALYKINEETNESSSILMKTKYDGIWQAIDGDSVLPLIRANSCCNMFLLEGDKKSNKTELRIEYGSEKYQKLGFYTQFGILLFLLFYLLVSRVFFSSNQGVDKHD